MSIGVDTSMRQYVNDLYAVRRKVSVSNASGMAYDHRVNKRQE